MQNLPAALRGRMRDPFFLLFIASSENGSSDAIQGCSRLSLCVHGSRMRVPGTRVLREGFLKAATFFCHATRVLRKMSLCRLDPRGDGLISYASSLPLLVPVLINSKPAALL